MVKGNDYLYIGLGVGALYLVYKATQGVEKIGSGILDSLDNLKFPSLNTSMPSGNSIIDAYNPLDPSLFGVGLGKETGLWIAEQVKNINPAEVINETSKLVGNNSSGFNLLDPTLFGQGLGQKTANALIDYFSPTKATPTTQTFTPTVDVLNPMSTQSSTVISPFVPGLQFTPSSSSSSSSKPNVLESKNNNVVVSSNVTATATQLFKSGSGNTTILSQKVGGTTGWSNLAATKKRK